MKIRFTKSNKHAIIPAQGATSFDVYAVDTFIVQSGGVTNHNIGLRVSLPALYYAWILPTGHSFAKGINVNGVIDEKYEGDWVVTLHNMSKAPIKFNKGDAIAQVILTPKRTEFQILEEEYEC